MPYIKNNQRNIFGDLPKDLGYSCDNAGELNYVFTVIVQNYLRDKGLNYQNINDCIGVLEGSKLELYRRIAAPYEDIKIDENGDVKQV
jgi:hypothetical protein